MEGRSRVAAAAAAVIPFHCVICFDEFDVKDRPPMILPCGHTYVCLPCTKRLKKCMECREPLHINVNPPVNNKQTAPLRNSHYRSSRYSPQAPVTPPHRTSVPPAQTVPLPIPKNLVLISMIEATQSQMRARQSMMSEDSLSDTHSDMGMQRSADEDQFDLNQIIGGLATFAGPSGTYAVRDSAGLTVVPRDPAKTEDSGSIEESIEAEIEIVRGQKLQVVEFQNGVARLARNQGFVQANSSQLVKVGNPLDESCHYEGLLKTVVGRGKDLQRELDENLKIEMYLRDKVEEAMEAPETVPVISDRPEMEDIEPMRPRSKSCDDAPMSYHPTTPLRSKEEISQPVLRTPEQYPDYQSICAVGLGLEPRPCGPSTQRQGLRQVEESPTSSLEDTVIDGRLPPYRRSIADDENYLVSNCGTIILGQSGHLFTCSVSEDDENRDAHAVEVQRLDPALVSDFHRTEMLTANQSSSFDCVDFRTGLSGHRGLTTAKKGHSTPRSRIPMMSAHRGIGHLRRRRGNNTSPSTQTALALPQTGPLIPIRWTGSGS